MQDSMDAVQEGCSAGGKQDRRGSGQVGCRTGVMPESCDAGKYSVEVQESWDAGRGMQD